MEGDPDGATGGHGAAVGVDDVAQRCPKRAGGLRGHHGLSVLEADAEEEAAGVGPTAQASGAAGGEGVHLELEDARWLHLRREQGGPQLIRSSCPPLNANPTVSRSPPQNRAAFSQAGQPWAFAHGQDPSRVAPRSQAFFRTAARELTLQTVP